MQAMLADLFWLSAPQTLRVCFTYFLFIAQKSGEKKTYRDQKLTKCVSGPHDLHYGRGILYVLDWNSYFELKTFSSITLRNQY
jgi:hypothetical protein